MSRLTAQDALVSTAWLADHLTTPDIRIVDASWFLPGSGQTGKQAYELAHIPGAVFFDIDQIKDDQNPLPHMSADATKFASAVRKLGIGNGNRVVVYDRAAGNSAAARVWWNFRLFGHEDVALLDGGLAKWLAESRPVEDLPPPPRVRHFVPRVNQTLIRSKAQMLANLESRREIVIDARSSGRFAGDEPDPWPHRKLGHIPGSLSLPWTELIDPVSKTFWPIETLRTLFPPLAPDQGVVASCGSGVTACMLAFALHLLGRDDVALYDGSWAEWGMAEDTPAELGPSR